MRQKIDAFVKNLLVFLMGLMLVNVVWQVFSRYILSSPSTFSGELARYLLIWVSLLGAAYISGKKMHLSITLLPNKLTPGARRLLYIIINLLIIAFGLLVMTIGGMRLVYITFILDQTSPALQVPLAYVYSVIPVSGLLIIYYKLLDIKYLAAKGFKQQNFGH